MATFIRILKVIAAVALCEAAGVVGGLFTAPAIPTWYAALAKPAFTPPSWVFGPAWTTLYLMMGVAAGLVWLKGWRTPRVKPALAVFLAQLAVNVLWSVVFFGLRSPGPAVAVIAVLWFGIVATVYLFRRVTPASSYLLLPYLLWVTFASALNVAVWRLNA